MLGLKTLSRAYKEFILWKRLYNVTKKPEVEKELKQYGFKVSWLGYPYKIVEIPNEFLENRDFTQNYMWEQLKEMNETITIPLNISELCFPNLVDIAKGAYLVKLESKFENLKAKYVIPLLLMWAGIIWISTQLFIKYDLLSYIEMAFDFIKNLVS